MSELEPALDELYGVDLDDFISTRTRLTKELKGAGAKEAAAAFAGARKPVVSAWTINQLARRRRKDVDLLLDAGHRLRQAQSSVLRGEDSGDFAAARSTERAVVARLLETARALLAERGAVSDSVLEQISETLRAGAVSDDGRELIARGRLERPFAGEGFEILTALVPPAGTPQPNPQAERRDSQREAVRAAKASLREAEKGEREREREASAAEQEAAQLKRAWESASQHAQAARAAADAAAGETEAAARHLQSIERHGEA